MEPGRPPPDELSPAPQPSPPPRQRWPAVSGAVLVSSVAMFLLDRFLLQRITAPDGTVLGQLQPLALYGPLVQRGEYWRMLGYAVEHGGPIHLLFNMSAVYTLGFMLERVIGSGRFLGLCLITCVGSAAFALFFDFAIPMVGASGMILGWAGAMLPIATRQGRQELGFWLIQVVVISLLPGVSWAGHLGGFLFGLPCGIALRLGAPVYAKALPLLFFITAVVALYAAHPERRGGLF